MDPGGDRGRGGRKRGRGGRPPKAAVAARAAAAEEAGLPPPKSAQPKAPAQPKGGPPGGPSAGEGGGPGGPAGPSNASAAAAHAALSGPMRALNAPPPPPAVRGPANRQGMLGRGLMGLSARRGRGSRGVGRAGLGRGALLAPGALFADAGPSKPSKPHPEEPTATEGGEGVVAPNAFRGTFTKDLRVMQYGYGDDESPLQETVDLMEDILLQYISSVVARASATANDTMKTRLDERDILFVVRKDPAKFARVKELLLLQQIIRDARNSFKQEIAPAEVMEEEGEGRKKSKHARTEGAANVPKADEEVEDED